MHDPQETGGNTDDTTVSPAPRRRIRHDRTTWLALGTAGIALVVALFSVLVSAVALHRSSNTHTVAAGSAARPSVSPTDTSGGDPPTSAQTSTDNPVVSTTDASVPTDSETIDPKADYTIAYRGERLRIQPTCGSRYVDLDEPRVGTGSGNSELSYSNCSGRQLDNTSGVAAVAQVTSPDASPGDCAEAIRTAPINLPIPPSAGLNLCVVTSNSEAIAEGISQKVVLLTIDSIAEDDTLDVTVSAWEIPH